MTSSDLRHTLRTLAQQPGSSLLVVLVLALGLAGVVAILTVIKTLVWDPLPYARAGQLLHAGWRDTEIAGRSIQGIAGNELLDWRQRLEGQAVVGGFSTGTINLSDRQGADRFDGSFVTHQVFSMLGVPPLLGRSFVAADDLPDAESVVILSHAVWQRRFGGDPEVIGRAVRANARPATIVGVMPPDFAFPFRQEVWLPAPIQIGVATVKDRHLQTLLEPLPGSSPAALQQILEGWMADARRVEPQRWANPEIRMENLGQMYADEQTRALLGVMLAVVGMVLLVACANAANLMLARTLARSRDLALRLTLGASRRSLVWHLLAQSLALTLLALLLALPLAQIGVDAVMAGFEGTNDGPPPWMDFRIDATMAALAFGVAVLTAVLVALLPVLRLRVDALGSALRDGGRAVAGGGNGRLSRLLVAGQVVAACIVLLATLVLVRGVDALNRMDLGIDQERLLTARIGLFEQSYPSDADLQQFGERLGTVLRSHPQLLQASVSTTLPGDMATTMRVQPEGLEIGDGGAPFVRTGRVDEHFAATWGLRLLSGRFIDGRDRADSEPVAVVDQAFVERYFPGQDPLGRRVRIPAEGNEAHWHTVIGVVNRLHLEDPGDMVLPAALHPLAQGPSRFVTVAMRTRGDPQAFKPVFLELLRGVDPDTPAYWLRSYEETMASALAGERVLAGMFSAFGLVALLLAAAGLYGLIAQIVGQRTREIGVQRALGASALAVLRTLLGRTLVQLGIGLLLGIAIGVPFAGLIGDLLSGIDVGATAVLWLVVMLGAVTLLATLLPARRALAIDPTTALRHE